MTAFPKLDEVEGKLKERNAKLHGIFEEAGADYDMSKVKSLDGDSKSKVDQIRTLNEEIDSLGEERDSLLMLKSAADRARKAKDGGEEKPEFEDGADHKGKRDRGEEKSIGELFTESNAYKNHERGSSAGPTSEIAAGIKALFQTSAGIPPETTRTGKLVEMAQPPLDVLDLVPTTTTGQIAVVYMEETLYNNTAAEVAEGGTYPEAELGLTEKSSPVRKIAVYLPMTDEQMEDVPYAQSYVNSRLPLMVRQRLNRQILVGSGTSPNLRGVLNTAGIQTQAQGTDPLPDAFFKAMVKIQTVAQSMPTFHAINPIDWQEVRLSRTTDGIYIWGAPSEAGPTRMWGLPVAPVQSLPQKTGLTGDSSQFELAIRRGMDVQVSNSHADFFINGKQAVRADIRAALVVYRPQAFATVTRPA